MKIYTKDDESIFSNLTITTPSKIYGDDSLYYSHLYVDNEPLYFKFMKCQTKHGIMTSNKTIFTDIVFNHSNANDNAYIKWFRELEDNLKCILYSKYDKWFMYDMNQDEIDYAFISSLRNYKENNSIVRINIKHTEHLPSCSVFDEHEKVKSYNDVKKNFINGIIHVKGIQFTNNVFYLDIELKQIMILETESIFRNCLIKANNDMTHDNDVDRNVDIHVDIGHSIEFENKVENEVSQKIINELNKEKYDYSVKEHDGENQNDSILLLCNEENNTYKEYYDIVEDKDEDEDENENEDNNNDITSNGENIQINKKIEEYNLDTKNIHGSVNINNPYKDVKEYYEEIKKKVELSKEQYLEEQQKMNELYSILHNQEK